MIPQAQRMAQLPLMEQFTAAELFRGTMLTHSIVAYRDDRPGGSPQPDFTGDACPGFVPIRHPDTICVRERLPPGAAGVLINRTHTCRDLVLPINEVEMRLFDGIDGHRSVGEIAAASIEAGQGAESSGITRCRLRLWLWDQVVFDTSGSP